MTNTDLKSVDKKSIAKKIARFVVRHSASAVAVTLVHQNTETFSKIQKIQLYVGAYYVGQVVADACWSKGEQQFDAVATAIEGIVASIKDEQSESSTED